MKREIVCVVAVLSDGTVDIRMPNELPTEIYECIAANVLRFAENNGADRDNVLDCADRLELIAEGSVPRPVVYGGNVG